MAGTLVIDTLNASSGVLAARNGMTGIAKAWCYFNGSAGTIYSAFNVSSITRSSTGIYVLNFTTAMPDSNYACAGMLSGPNGMPYNLYLDSASNGGSPTTKSTSQCQLRSTGTGGTADMSYVSCLVLGN